MVHFDNIFVFQSLLKDEVALKSQCFPKAEDEERPVPALTIPFLFLFPEPAFSIPFTFLLSEPALTIRFLANKFPNKLAS